MAAEVIVAVLSGSLALLSDAGHMLSGVGAIAAANGITLLVVSGIVAVEAVNRLIHPPSVDGGPVAVVAAAGIAVNIAAAGLLARANRSSLNIQGAFRHVLTDLHAWTVTSNLPALSAHIIIDDACFTDGCAPGCWTSCRACIAGHFDVEHSTFQLEAAAHASHEPGPTDHNRLAREDSQGPGQPRIQPEMAALDRTCPSVRLLFSLPCHLLAEM